MPVLISPSSMNLRDTTTLLEARNELPPVTNSPMDFLVRHSMLMSTWLVGEKRSCVLADEVARGTLMGEVLGFFARERGETLIV